MGPPAPTVPPHRLFWVKSWISAVGSIYRPAFSMLKDWLYSLPTSQIRSWEPFQLEPRSSTARRRAHSPSLGRCHPPALGNSRGSAAPTAKRAHPHPETAPPARTALGKPIKNSEGLQAEFFFSHFLCISPFPWRQSVEHTCISLCRSSSSRA